MGVVGISELRAGKLEHNSIESLSEDAFLSKVQKESGLGSIARLEDM